MRPVHDVLLEDPDTLPVTPGGLDPGGGAGDEGHDLPPDAGGSGDRGGPRRARRRQPTAPGPRRLVTVGVLAVDGLAVWFTEAGVGGPLRLWLGLAFVLAVPGWSLVGYLRLAWPAAEVSLAVAASLAVTLLGSEIMLWTHAWHPVDLQAALGAAAALLLVGQLLGPFAHREARR